MKLITANMHHHHHHHHHHPVSNSYMLSSKKPVQSTVWQYCHHHFSSSIIIIIVIFHLPLWLSSSSSSIIWHFSLLASECRQLNRHHLFLPWLTRCATVRNYRPWCPILSSPKETRHLLSTISWLLEKLDTFLKIEILLLQKIYKMSPIW